jgi:hypothetical protein
VLSEFTNHTSLAFGETNLKEDAKAATMKKIRKKEGKRSEKDQVKEKGKIRKIVEIGNGSPCKAATTTKLSANFIVFEKKILTVAQYWQDFVFFSQELGLRLIGWRKCP